MRNRKNIIISFNVIVVIIAIFILKIGNKNKEINEFKVSEKNITTNINTISVASEQTEERITTILPSNPLENNDVILNGVENTKNTEKIVRDRSKVTITIEEESLTLKEAVIIITDTNEYPYFWDNGFKLQIKENNKWKDLTFLDNNPGFILLAYQADENGQTRLKIDFEKYYGELGLRSISYC